MIDNINNCNHCIHRAYDNNLKPYCDVNNKLIPDPEVLGGSSACEYYKNHIQLRAELALKLSKHDKDPFTYLVKPPSNNERDDL